MASDETPRLYALIGSQALAKMGGSRGKMMAQAGHAYLHSYWDAEARFPEAAAAYRNSERAYKIALLVPDDEMLPVLYHRYRDICGVTLVKDAGLTVFAEPTLTCVGLGPIYADQIGLDIKALKALQ